MDFGARCYKIRQDGGADQDNVPQFQEIYKMQIWDTAGQERFHTITTAYYRGALGVMMVYDVTDKKSFDDIINWLRAIKEHANPNVEKMIIGNILS